MANGLSVIVLAAGKGTRMKNGLPKVLHPLAGSSLVGHVLITAGALAPDTLITVLSPGAGAIEKAARAFFPDLVAVVQDPPMGTGHAVLAARPALAAEGDVLVLYGDTPLIAAATLERLIACRRETDAAIAVLGMAPPDPSGYGRLRFAGEDLVELVEERHADAELRANGLCNSGVMVFDAARLPELLAAMPLRPEKNEYYLTDTVHLAVERGWRCRAITADWREGHGVNSQTQLAEAEAFFQERRRAELLAAGVIMPVPGQVQLSFDTVIEPGAWIEPYTVFGPGVRIGAGARVRAFSHIEGASVASGAEIGPFARLRPGTRIESDARVGNFVEVKNAAVGEGAKISHLSYIGDATVGEASNVGAGTITCNYDGVAKHRTEIGAAAFIGSNTALVAPVRIGAGAMIGAGSTITEDVEADALAIGRARQRAIADGGRRLRERLKTRKV